MLILVTCVTKYNYIAKLTEMKLILNFNQEQQKTEGNQNLFVIYNLPLPLNEDLHILTSHPEIMLICDACERKLNSAASVLLDGEARRDYCFTCFAKTSTKPSQNYYLRPNLSLSLTEDGWCVLGELLLMDSLLKQGYGKWLKIKNYMDYHGYNFTSQQIQAHYNQFYMTSDLKPAFTDCLHDWQNFSAYQHEPSPINQQIMHQNVPSETAWIAYDPKRQEHFLSYNPQAQNLVSDLEFYPDDSQEETQLKFQQLEEYDYHVRQRKKREQFVAEHHILSEQHHKLLLSEGMAKADARKAIQKFSSYMSFQQAEDLSSCIAFHNTLKAAILELSKGRKRGKDPSFNQKYAEIVDKKQMRRLINGLSPIDLVQMPINKVKISQNEEIETETIKHKIMVQNFIQRKEAKMRIVKQKNK